MNCLREKKRLYGRVRVVWMDQAIMPLWRRMISMQNGIHQCFMHNFLVVWKLLNNKSMNPIIVLKDKEEVSIGILPRWGSRWERLQGGPDRKKQFNHSPDFYYIHPLTFRRQHSSIRWRFKCQCVFRLVRCPLRWFFIFCCFLNKMWV